MCLPFFTKQGWSMIIISVIDQWNYSYIDQPSSIKEDETIREFLFVKRGHIIPEMSKCKIIKGNLTNIMWRPTGIKQKKIVFRYGLLNNIKHKA